MRRSLVAILALKYQPFGVDQLQFVDGSNSGPRFVTTSVVSAFFDPSAGGKFCRLNRRFPKQRCSVDLPS